MQRRENEEMRAWAGLSKAALAKVGDKAAAVLGACRMPDRDFPKWKL